ncbi:MAG: DUF3427 domain-containing protein [bacterium]|nr:DUF3427 domain-containing protein [bacterium]
MSRLERGVFEQLIDDGLLSELEELDAALTPIREPLRAADVGDRLAFHFARLVERSVDGLPEKERVARGIALARGLIETIAKELDRDEIRPGKPVAEGSVLRALVAKLPNGSLEQVESPLIPLLDTTLLTNAPGEPRVGHQIKTEISTAQRIDVVMAFVRRSGIQPFLEAFRKHCAQGRDLRILTTTYTGSTEKEALEKLESLGAKVRVSYDTKSTRLHAKAWLFQRSGGVSTAYVGSSNLTHSAQVAGLEWNVRVSGVRNPGVIEKIGAVFEAYWEGGDFEPFSSSEFDRQTATRDGPKRPLLSPLEVRPYPFQERLLEQIEVAREAGRHRNLLVSATGTGKTVMAAIDYAGLRKRMKRARLLFVAHREEILSQSMATYAQVLRDQEFGELWVGGKVPSQWENVFASIQSLTRTGLGNVKPDHFDVVVVDEFHHAAAKSYKTLLEHVAPVELLGLTATPERADGLPILDWFDGRIAAELRLWDAIDQHRLVPFVYYGVHDGVDLTQVPWKRGRGYDLDGLSNVYTGNDIWARLVLDQLSQRVDDLSEMRALGFCVSVDHARFMSRVFNELGVPSAAVWGDSPQNERQQALKDLRRGEIRILFSVDLFNEGIDLPDVDTLLLLRPTDSPTLFLQQLGRGLRKSKDKYVCLVLDFIGQHRREFRFDRRLRALLGGTRKDVQKQVEGGFPFLPAGCHMELERKARDIVLRSIKGAVPEKWTAKAVELKQIADKGVESLSGFLDESGLDLEDVYGDRRGWSDLKEAAGLSVLANGPEEPVLRRACGRLLHIDDAVRLDGYREILAASAPPNVSDPGSSRSRLARMLVASVCDQALSKRQTLREGLDLLWRHPQVRSELTELLDVLAGRVDHQHFSLTDNSHVPLQVHARYTRLEILGAFRAQKTAKVQTWREGVYWLPEEKADLLAFTLDKTSGQFSPTTRYKDYAISTTLIHWESQTGAGQETRGRYENHETQGSSIMLFARLRQDDRAFWFLGPATYVEHKDGDPMAVTWKLKHPLPGDVFASFAAAVA